MRSSNLPGVSKMAPVARQAARRAEAKARATGQEQNFVVRSQVKDLIAHELAKGASRSAISKALSDEYCRSGYPIVEGRTDLHARCVHKDGTIWDPDSPEYVTIKTRNGVPLETPRMYEELTGELKRRTWANIWTQILKPRLSPIPEVTKQQVFALLVQVPTPCNCFFNAWANSQVTGARFTIGNGLAGNGRHSLGARLSTICPNRSRLL